MRPPLGPLLMALAAIFLCGCSVNEAELAAIQARLDARLAALRSIADEMSMHRHELDRLEKLVVELGGALPPVTIRERAAPTQAVGLPPVSPLEDGDAARLRAQIADTQRRLIELNSVLGDLDYLEERRVLLYAKLRDLRP